MTRCAALALLALASASASASASGASFPLPADGSTVVGEVRVVRLEDARNTLLDLARHYDLGYDEIVAANPGTSVWLPGAGARIVVPTELILPPKPWAGVVINVARRRLYYFPKPGPGEPRRVVTFPIGIAQPGWPTPLGRTRIVAKFKDPSWIVPNDILDEHHPQGQPDGSRGDDEEGEYVEGGCTGSAQKGSAQAYLAQKYRNRSIPPSGSDFTVPRGTAPYAPLDHDQRNTLSVGGEAKLPWHARATANVAYGSGFTNGAPGQPYPGDYLPGHTTVDLSLGKDFGKRYSLSVTALNVANRRVELDNSLTFGGFHWNSPREIYGSLLYRFHS